MYFEKDPFLENITYPKRASNHLYILISSILAILGYYIEAHILQLDRTPIPIIRRLKFEKPTKIF